MNIVLPKKLRIYAYITLSLVIIIAIANLYFMYKFYEPRIFDKQGLEYGVMCKFDYYDCKDFYSYDAAQQTYRFCLTMVQKDVHNLDKDNDGFACEDLRNAVPF